MTAGASLQLGRRAGSIEVRGLTLSIGRSEILRGVDLSVPNGAITGLAGESGSGKTMTGLAICGLQPQGSRVRGSIALQEADAAPVELLSLSGRAMNRLRGRRIAMIFQDPSSSLHPMLSIGAQLSDHVRYHLGLDRAEAKARAVELLERVRVPDPQGAIRRYPHQFSGGQLQRIAIAGAIACDPVVLIADEPTTALDVTVQAGILRLLRELCDDLGLAVVLVTHDLGVMSAIADTVAVMRTGVVVEHGSRYQVIREPVTDYARELVASLPHVPPPGAGRVSAPGLPVQAAPVGEGDVGAPVGDGPRDVDPLDVDPLDVDPQTSARPAPPEGRL
ncbi:MAG: ABC transporter ATP-binding protein [Lapillicoccus sp.]